MNMTRDDVQVTRTPMRARYLGVLLVLVALVLSACGARVETDLGLENAEKGSRTMSISFNMKDNKDYVKGDINSIDSSIKKHLPSELSYEGIQTDGDKARATFKLSFTSISEYRTKVENLLKLSGSSTTPTISISDSTTGLVQGVQVSENFSSKELLGWVPESLVVDGVIESKRKSSVLGTEDKTTVKMGDRELKNSSSSTPISVKDIKDNGFGFVLVDAQVQQNGSYTAKIFFVAKDIMEPDKAKAVDSYLQSATPEGGQVSKGVDEASIKSYYTVSSKASTSAGKEELGRTLTFEASNLEDMNSKLQKIFGNKNTELKHEQEVNDTSGKLMVKNHVSGQVDCSIVCSPEGNGTLFKLSGSNGAYTEQGSSSNSGSSKNIVQNVDLSSTQEIKVQDARTSVSLGMDGSVEARFEYSVKNSDAALASEALKKKFSPGDDIGTLEEGNDGDNTVYSTVIKGKDSADFNNRLEGYLPGSTFTITHPGGYNPFGTSYTVEPAFNLKSRVGDGYSGSYSFSFNAPFMSTVDQKKFETQNSLPEGARTEAEGRNLTVSNEHGTFTLRIPAAGLTMSDMVIDGVIVLLVLLIVMILLLFRRRISSSLRNSREQRAALAAAQQAQGYGHGGNPETYFMSRSGGGHQTQGYSPAQPAYSEEGNYQQDQYPPQKSGYGEPPTVPINDMGSNGAWDDKTHPMPQYAPQEGIGEPTVPTSYQQVTYEEPTQAISGNGAVQHEPPARPVSEQPRSGSSSQREQDYLK